MNFCAQWKVRRIGHYFRHSALKTVKRSILLPLNMLCTAGFMAVSYTHLDVYKRQVPDCTEQLHQAEKIAIGAGAFAVSAKTGKGLDSLAEYLRPGKTVVFLGSSGVGKSSLVNALAGEEIMSTGEIREEDSRGRHTTTHRQLLMLPSGVMIIDTPGMRELGMWDVTDGIGQSFADVEQYFGQCRFSDCRHQSEPGCAVKAAIQSGALSAERWESYCRLKSEAKFSDDKSGYLREKQQWHKNIAKINRSNRKNGKPEKW